MGGGGTKEVTATNLAVVLICVQHDGGVGQDVDHIWVLEKVWALQVVSGTKALHDAVDLLCFSRQPE